jgi:hypothetical protein
MHTHTHSEDKSDDAEDNFCEKLDHGFDQFPRYDMKILFGDFSAKVDGIFKPTIGNKSSHEISNGNGVRGVNFATSENVIVKSTMFLHCNIHKYTRTSSEGKKHNQIDHILIDWRRHSSMLDVWSVRGADCDTDHYLVVAEVGSEQATCTEDGYGEVQSQEIK